ncbi:MAG: dTDP-4-dehydrorhamnose 3,5-epimerase family protein [Candidatus Kerfeldbacteria bacterium]|nr:dTDP-4-dehydrorhamnose 3,5-epimerase family protein [Candidatus Kerfeldbacteria bacterium]
MAKRITLSKQSYQPKPTIEGVQLIELKTFVDDGGYFIELGRFRKHVFEHFPKFDLQQLNLSEMDPGVIKAWHIHEHQDDIWFVPPSQRMLVALKDIRPASPTRHALMRFVLGGGTAQLVLIPHGIAHGAANLWQTPSLMLYLVNSQFTADPKKSDEYRLPWDQFGADIWQQTKG